MFFEVELKKCGIIISGNAHAHFSTSATYNCLFYILTETKFKITTVSAMSLRFFLKKPEP